MQYDNFALGPNLSNGFTYVAEPNFTSGWCSSGQFCDATGNNRQSDWAFDILNVEFAVENRTPEITDCP